MQIQLQYEPNVLFECAVLITDRADGRSFRDLKEELRNTTRAEASILDGCFDAIIDFSEQVIGKLTADPEVLQHLFVTHEELGASLASYLLHDAFCAEHPAFPKAVEDLRSQSKATFFANIYSLLLERFPDLRSEVKVDSYGEFINFISCLPVSAELKWELCSFYNGFEQMRGVLADIMLEAGNAYLETYPMVRHHVEWFTANYKMTSGADPMRLICELCPEAKDKQPDVLYLVPSVAAANRSLYKMNYLSESFLDFVFAGVLCIPLRQVTEKPFDTDAFCRALRVMSDPSKLQILRLCSEERVYGIRLAEALGLTTATVSHHMSQLAEQGLVQTERDANRVYYRTDREALAKVASDFLRIFRLDV